VLRSLGCKLSRSELLEATRALDYESKRIIQGNMREIALVSALFASHLSTSAS
jgi:ABC-type bacteriocin/lantibiotic exporter with double-glycine peptidase domain